jgi:hypothetical protein
MTREEPSLKTLWLRNMGTIDKVQKIDCGNKTSSSKTFRGNFLISSATIIFSRIIAPSS